MRSFLFKKNDVLHLVQIRDKEDGMMSTRILIVFIIVLACTVHTVFADSPWNLYTDTNYVQDIAVEGDYIWCATWGGVARWNRIDMT